MSEKNIGDILRTKLEIEWKIKGSSFLERNVDEYIGSQSFSLCGAVWLLKLYPNGRRKNGSEGHISIYFFRSDTGAPKTLSFKFTFKMGDRILKECVELTHTLPDDQNYQGWGFQKALKTSELLQTGAQLTPTSFLTIICFIKIHPESIEEPKNLEASSQTELDYYTEKLSQDLNNLLVSGEDSNLIVQVKGKEFRLHQGIMGVRTPVFRAMFQHEMKEKAMGTVLIDDCEVDVFEAFVYYVYSGRVDKLCTETAFGLFVLADKYQVDELKSACYKFIKCTLSVDTFCDFVRLALTFEDSELLLQATNFLANNMIEVMKTGKWIDFLKESHTQANELMLNAVSLKLN